MQIGNFAFLLQKVAATFQISTTLFSIQQELFDAWLKKKGIQGCVLNTLLIDLLIPYPYS